jgi:geranylgeranyl pyrophosphate synthase
MLIGDMALCLSHYYALDSHFETSTKIAGLSSFIDNLVLTGLGQTMDLQLSVDNNSASSAEIEGMTSYKTAFYSVVAPMQLGAQLAACSNLLIKHIEGFGEPLGVAYQIKDDLLGIFGDEAEIGKSNLSDLIEGKQTLIMKRGLECTKGQDRAFLRHCLRRKNITPNDLDKVRQILRDCGAEREVEALASEHQERAISAIPSLTLNARLQAVVQGLCSRLVHRSR